ncbi:hypothetical protein C0992_008621, partial [Termitomyces sp. T32_za158]
MGDMAFSGGFETLAAGKDPEGWLDVLHMGVGFVGVLGQVPWTRDILALAPAPGPIMSFQKFAGKKIQETRHKSGELCNDILSIIQNDTEGGMELTQLQAHADASFIILAGSDTVSEAMTALIRYICADPDVQSQLREEILAPYEEVEGTSEDVSEFSKNRLPYLDACIQEALRLVPPVAAGPPRWNKDIDTQILDHVIPAGTTVACPNYAMFRDPHNFADPDSFRPERWTPHGIIGPHNKEAFVPWCYGPGVCIGKPVALYNMKLLTTALLERFEVSFAEDFDVERFDESYK